MGLCLKATPATRPPSPDHLSAGIDTSRTEAHGAHSGARQAVISRLERWQAWWMKHMRVADGWRFIAVHLSASRAASARTTFQELFTTIDQIAILTDVIRGCSFTASTSVHHRRTGRKHSRNATVATLTRRAPFSMSSTKDTDGKDAPKRSRRAIRAAITAGLFITVRHTSGSSRNSESCARSTGRVTTIIPKKTATSMIRTRFSESW